MSKSNSDSPLSEDKLWGNVSPKSRLKAYMPLNRKTSYKIEDDLEEQLNNLLDEQDNKLVDLPIAPSGLLFPDVPTGKLERKTQPLVFPAVPRGPLSRKPQKLTVLEQLALERSKLAAKAKSQTKKNRTMREKLDALVSRFKKGGTRKSTLSTFRKSGAKSRKSTFRKSGAKSRAKSRKSTFKKGGAKSKSR